MYLFHIILKLIQEFNLTTTSEYNKLFNDVQEWESGATEDSKDKTKQLYAKLHKGVWFRLITPFLYFFLVKWVVELKNPKDSNILDID